jgi:hypothetical protein
MLHREMTRRFKQQHSTSTDVNGMGDNVVMVNPMTQIATVHLEFIGMAYGL